MLSLLGYSVIVCGSRHFNASEGYVFSQIILPMCQCCRSVEGKRERECLLHWNFIHFIIYVNGYVRLDIINEMCFENIYACKEKLYTIILLKYIILNGYTPENPPLLKN